MRTALCLFGLIGSIDGKSGDTRNGQLQVLKLSHKHWKKYILKKNDVDIFIHCWNTDIQNEINDLFRPTRFLYEEQIKFEIPELVKGEEKRKQSHYSRWYSAKTSIDLKSKFERKKRFKYDCVMSARFDIAWQKPIFFADHDMSLFYSGGWHRSSRSKLKDFWFFSNSDNMNKFGELYSHLDEYNLAEDAPINKQLGISNHRLAKYHLNKLNIRGTSVLECNNDYDPSLSDYPLVRYKYFNAKV